MSCFYKKFAPRYQERCASDRDYDDPYWAQLDDHEKRISQLEQVLLSMAIDRPLVEGVKQEKREVVK